MTKPINKKTLIKLTKCLLSLKAVEHKKPKEPNKAELNKKFVMRISSKGKVKMKEAV